MMIANEPSNQQLSLNDLNIIQGLIEAKLAELSQTITLRQSHGFSADHIFLLHTDEMKHVVIQFLVNLQQIP